MRLKMLTAGKKCPFTSSVVSNSKFGYRTFDGLNAVYRGTCPIRLFKTTDKLGRFDVVYDSYGFLHVYLPDHEVVFDYNTVWVDGAGYRNSPAFNASLGNIHFTSEWYSDDYFGGKTTDAARITVTSDFGLRMVVESMTYRSFHELKITVPSSAEWKGMVVGMGGNNDDDTSNDLTKPDGALAADVNEWGDSWALDVFGLDEPYVAYNWHWCVFGRAVDDGLWNHQHEMTSSKCKYLPYKQQGMKNCWGVLTQEQFGRFYNNCLYEIQPSNQDSECAAFKPFADTCNKALQKQGKSSWDWHTDLGCPEHRCGENAHWNSTSSPCVNSCLDPYASDHCPGNPVQQCECDINTFGRWVREEGACINVNECDEVFKRKNRIKKP